MYPIRYTALHCNRNSSIAQIISKRIDQSRPVLLLIGDARDFWLNRFIDCIHPAAAIHFKARMGHLVVYIPVGHMAAKYFVSYHQVLADRFLASSIV